MTYTFEHDGIDKILGSRGLSEKQAVQRYIDSSVLRYSEPYIPMDTGMLIKSGTIHTVIGSGEVRYCTPYARKMHYTNTGKGRQGTAGGGLRGKEWFKRMKADKKDVILKGVKAFLSSRGNG